MMFRMWLLFATLVVLVGVAVQPAGAQSKHVVMQKNRAFVPKSLKVKAGDTVVFKNEDTVAHNVFSTSAGNKFDLRIQRPGGQSPIELLQAGAAEIRCAIHPGMKLQVQVNK